LVDDGTYVPDAGDLVWLTLDPTQGHEQTGRRPALVLTPRFYNARTKLAVCCPLTTQIKGYPFEVHVDSASGVAGVVLVDQLKSLDWVTRRADRIGSVDDSVMTNVRTLLKTLLAIA
jgi:mRNA interferase MazF